MNLTIWVNFSKRRNSTKRPSGGDGVYDVRLKEDTTLMHPHFIMTATNIDANYCMWAGRYYYINDIIFLSNDMRELVCELDVLATFKTDIGNYTTLISRADSDFNTSVIDTIYPAKANPHTYSSQLTGAGLFTTNRDSGAIIMGVIGTGGLEFFVMSPAAFRSLCYVLFPVITQSPDVYFASAISEALVGGLNSVMNSIVLLKWLPISWTVAVSQLGLTAASDLYIGQLRWNLNGMADVYRLTGNTVISIAAKTITFPDRVYTGITQRGDWLYMQPFADFTLNAPPFGVIRIDGTFLVPSNRVVTAVVRAEMLSGNAQLGLYFASGQKIEGKYNTCISYDIKAGGAAVNFGGQISGLASAVASAMTHNYAGAAAGIISAAESMIPKPAQAGAGIGGPVPDMADIWTAVSTYFDPVEENKTELGRPLAEVRQINTLSGFVQCADAHCPIPGHEDEMIKVNEFLNTGIFYE